MEDIEKKIVYGELKNEKETLKEYIIQNYGG